MTATTTVFTTIRLEEEHKLAHKRHLQRLLHDETKSIIERTKARVELALLTSDAAADDQAEDEDANIDDTVKRSSSNCRHNIGSNCEELPSGIVTRTTAEMERDIQRHAERQRREEPILRLVAQLKEQGALKSEARRQRLEKELEQAMEDMARDMEQWEKDEDAKVEEEGVLAATEDDGLPGVDVAEKEELSRHHIRRVSRTEDDEEEGGDSSQEQLALLLEEQVRSLQLPPSFYKSSPSLVVVAVAPEEEHPQDQSEEKDNNATPPPYRSKESFDSCCRSKDTYDTSSIISDTSTTSTVENSNASPSSSRTVPLERQVQMFLKESELREESMQLMATELERLELKNNTRVDKLKRHAMKLTKELEGSPQQIQYWKQKCLEFSKKVYTLEVELDEKEESIEDMVEFKQIQDVKIESLEREIEVLRVKRTRDRAEKVVDKLLIPPKRDITRRASNPFIAGITNSWGHSTATEETADLDETYRKEEESNKVKVLALEAKVARIAQEKAKMEVELEEMRLLLSKPNAKAEKNQRGERKDRKSKKSTKTQMKVIYQVSCRKCPKGKNCAVVGVTTEDLNAKVLALAKQSVTAAGEKKTFSLLNSSTFKPGGHSSCNSVDESTLTEEKTQEDAFIHHLASHIPKKVAKNEKEAISFCKKIVKVEVLTKESGEELYWQDPIDE